MKLDEQVLLRLMFHSNGVDTDKIKKRVKKKINDLYYKIDRLYESYARSEIEEKAYTFTLANLQRDLDALIDTKIALKQKDLRDWENMSDAQKTQFISIYIAYVVVDFDLGIVVSIKFKKALD